MRDVLVDLPGYALRRASASMQAEFAALLMPLALRPTDASMLVLIEANAGITPSALGQMLAIQRANMVPIVSRFDECGYIKRIALDGRSFGLTLSDEGTRVCAKVKLAMKTHEHRIMERIPEKHRAHLVPALKALWSS